MYSLWERGQTRARSPGKLFQIPRSRRETDKEQTRKLINVILGDEKKGFKEMFPGNSVSDKRPLALVPTHT